MKNIILQTVHFKASEDLENFVNEKVSKLFEQDDSIIKAEVTLFEGASGNPKKQNCEITLSVPRENHFVKKNSEIYEKSILNSVDTLQKILRRKKQRK